MDTNEVDGTEDPSKEGAKSKSQWQKSWEKEVQAAEKLFKKYWKTADNVVKRFSDDREDAAPSDRTDQRVNLFWSHSRLLCETLYANAPKIDVGRKFKDANDDVARVASLLLQRALEYDMIENGEEYDTVMKQIVFDRVVPGLSCARVYYEYETETKKTEEELDEDGNVLVEASEDEEIIGEWVSLEYVYWGDVMWSWTRNWRDLRWVAFRSNMTRKEMMEEFDLTKKDLEQVEFKKQKIESGSDAGSDDTKDYVSTAEVWNIWDKESLQVFNWCAGMSEVISVQDDPLGLKGFFPSPRFWIANETTSLMMPKPDFAIVQDLYNEIDELNTRIAILTDACKVVGVYDQSSEGIKRMFEEGMENDLIPVDNWAMFAEKGGLQGQIDWLPIENVASVIDILTGKLQDKMLMVERVTGMSDIISGAGTHPREGVGTQEMKAEYGSVHIQSLEQRLAQFVTDVLEIKSQILCQICEPETLLLLANADQLSPADQQIIPEALQLLRDWESASMRIEVQADSMAQVDYTRMKRERGEAIEAMAMFMQSATGLIQGMPQALPTILEMLKWGLAPYKGSQQLEGILDQTIKQALSQPPQGPDDGKADAEKVKAQAEVEKERLRGQNEITKIREKAQADIMVIQSKLMAKLQEVEAKITENTSKEEAQAYFAAVQREVESQFEIMLAEVEAEISQEEERTRATIRAGSESGG